MPSEYLHKGDYVQSNEGGNVVFGTVIDDGVEYRGIKHFAAYFGPNNSTSGCNIPEAALIKLDSAQRQKEAVEQERRQSTLQVVLRLAEIHEKTVWATGCIEKSRRVAQPKTGVFVAVGIYSSHGAHDPYITVVCTNPHITPENLASKLRDMFPDGFDGIPAESYKLPGTSHGSLVGYKCVELPRKAADLIDWETRQVK